MRPPPLPHQIQVLGRVLDRSAAAPASPGGAPTVVFGLDGALYDVRPRTLQILMEYADEVREDFPEVADALGRLDTAKVHYLLSDTLRACNLTASDVVRDVTGFWRERFLSDEYCAYDVPSPGAQEYVQACYETGAAVVYLSARDVPGMLLGTVSSLRNHGFPIGVPGVALVLKPDATMGDEPFKRSALPLVARYGQVIGFFDNDPAACNLARAHFPDAEVALLEHQRVPGAVELEAQIEPVTDFRIG